MVCAKFETGPDDHPGRGALRCRPIQGISSSASSSSSSSMASSPCDLAGPRARRSGRGGASFSSFDVAVVGDAVPGVAERLGDACRRRPAAGENTVAATRRAPSTMPGVAEVEREDRDRGEDQQREREPRAAGAPGKGHRRRGALVAGRREEDALERLELLERLPGPDGHGVERVGGDHDRHAGLVVEPGLRARGAARRRRRA